MVKENSVERATRIIEKLKEDIEDDRNDEIEAKKRIGSFHKNIAEKKQMIENIQKEIKDLEERIADENEWIESVQKDKLDLLTQVQALTLFIQQGGGLDMF